MTNKFILTVTISIISLMAHSQKNPLDSVRNLLIKATNNLDASSAAGLFAQDAIQFPPGKAPIAGRDSIKANYTRFYGFMEAANLNLEPKEFMINGNLAVERGLYSLEVTVQNGQKTTIVLRYLLIFTKKENGWKIKWSMANKDQ